MTSDLDEHGNELNPFAEILRVMDFEQLIRFRHRLKKVGKKRMVEILTDEIEQREAMEQHAEAMEQHAIGATKTPL